MSGKTMQVMLPRGGFLDGDLVSGAKTGETVKVEPGKPVRVTNDYGAHLIHDRIAVPIKGKPKSDSAADKKAAEEVAAKEAADKKAAEEAAAQEAAAQEAADKKAAEEAAAKGGAQVPPQGGQ
ncbi:MAG: hypothetical protein AAGI03_01595 [Pseudomonadota bacterium]